MRYLLLIGGLLARLATATQGGEAVTLPNGEKGFVGQNPVRATERYQLLDPGNKPVLDVSVLHESVQGLYSQLLIEFTDPKGHTMTLRGAQDIRNHELHDVLTLPGGQTLHYFSGKPAMDTSPTSFGETTHLDAKFAFEKRELPMVENQPLRPQLTGKVGRAFREALPDDARVFFEPLEEAYGELNDKLPVFSHFLELFREDSDTRVERKTSWELREVSRKYERIKPSELSSGAKNGEAPSSTPVSPRPTEVPKVSPVP